MSGEPCFGTEQKIVYSSELPVKIELTRGQRGGYGWVISVQARSREEALDQVRKADATLRRQYLREEKDEAEADPPLQDGIRSEA
jgi:hypothetical protein